MGACRKHNQPHNINRFWLIASLKLAILLFDNAQSVTTLISVCRHSSLLEHVSLQTTIILSKSHCHLEPTTKITTILSESISLGAGSDPVLIQVWRVSNGSLISVSGSRSVPLGALILHIEIIHGVCRP